MIPSFAESYATKVYPVLITTISRITSIFPFSLIELLIFLLVFYFIVKIIQFILFLMHTLRDQKGNQLEKRSGLKQDLSIFRTLLLKLSAFLSLLLLIYSLTCGINYYRNTFASYANISVDTYTTADLTNLTKRLIKEMNELSTKVPVNEDGLLIIPNNVKEEAVNAMNHLGELYPVLSGYYPNPKPVLTSNLLSYQFTMGIYSPFTMEANYNNQMPPHNIPATICHELSHVKGFMREDEAEFIAYLACIYSDNIVFNYSGNLMALTKSLNALSESGENELYYELYNELSDQVKNQLANNDSFWEQYRGTISEIALQTNDVYLKVNNQSDGKKSYGRMVDLLLAYDKQMDSIN